MLVWCGSTTSYCLNREYKAANGLLPALDQTMSIESSSLPAPEPMSVNGCVTIDPEDDGTSSYDLRCPSSICVDMKGDGDGYNHEEYDNDGDEEEADDSEN